MAKKTATHDPNDTTWWMRKVRPIRGERRRFHAPSRSGGDDYLVDLEARGFRGQCGCPDHQTRKHRCWHIKLCQWVWYQLTIREQAAQDNPSDKTDEGA